MHQQLHNRSGLPNRSPSGIRRSSAAGITHRPPLPPNIGIRSHSLDGLLESASSQAVQNKTNLNSSIVGGVSETTLSTLTPPSESTERIDVAGATLRNSSAPMTTNNPPTNPNKSNHRRSRSMDDLLDERDEIQSDCDDRSKSMEHLADDIDHPNDKLANSDSLESDSKLMSQKYLASSESLSSLSRTNSPAEQPCDREFITVEHTIRRPSSNEIENEDDQANNNNSKKKKTNRKIIAENDNDPNDSNNNQNQCNNDDDDGDDDDDVISSNSNYSCHSSTTSKDSEKKKSFLNRYVKKVKSFIKK